jgi:hypothetical protein
MSRRRGGEKTFSPKKKRPCKKKEIPRATKEAEKGEDEEQLVEDLAQTRKRLAELAEKKGKKKVGSTAEETGETDEVEEEDVELDPVGTRVGGVLTKEGKNMSYTNCCKDAQEGRRQHHQHDSRKTDRTREHLLELLVDGDGKDPSWILCDRAIESEREGVERQFAHYQRGRR